jgi:RNA polymerase sigma factor (sigma-70 family)
MQHMADDKPGNTSEREPGASGVLAFPAAPLPTADAIEQILSQTYLREYESMLRYAAHLLRDDDEDDVVHKAFMEVWDRKPTHVGRKPIADYNAVLLRAIRFRALDYRKVRARQRKALAVYLNDWSVRIRRWMNPEERNKVRTLRATIDEAMEAMSPRVREIFVLHHEAGYSVEQIVERTGLGREGVRSFIARGKRIAREHLERSGQSPLRRARTGVTP